MSVLVALLLGPAPVLLASGRAAADASLQSGDLLVGVDAEQPGQGAVGAIVRVRDGQVSTLCQSPQPGSPGTLATDVFGVPTSVMVDSAGNVVFLADPRFGAGGTALFRCSTPGQVPERLAVFPGNPSEVAGTGYPLPFGNQSFTPDAGSLFLKPAVSLSITDSGVHLAKGDTYAMVAYTDGVNQELDYQVGTGTWTINPLPAPFATFPTLPSMVAHDQGIYGAGQGALMATTQPFQLDASGSVGGTSFDVSLGLFGGTHEITGPMMDDQTLPNVESTCQPSGDYSNSIPVSIDGATRTPLSDVSQVAWDESGPLGMVVKNSYAPLNSPYLANVDQRLINSNPLDDDSAKFLDDQQNCTPIPFVTFEPVVPSFADNGAGNGTDQIAAAVGGMVGTQKFAGRVVAIQDDGHHGLVPIVTGLASPIGIAGYPSQVSVTGSVLVIRIDSPIDVLLTAPDGRRIGIDPSTHQAVNDFADDGYVGAAGEPRFIALRNVDPGTFRVDTIGTGDGAFGFHVYTANIGTGDGHAISTSGTTTTGTTGRLDFNLAADDTVSFVDTAGPAASITASAGTPQSAQVVDPFATDLAALVTDGSGNAVPGASVTFSAPASGASGTFADGGTPGPTDTETTNESGVATATAFTANTVAGGYSVDATVSGVADPAVFSLTNTPGPASASTSTIAANPNTLPADGSTASNITVTLNDQYGNPVPGRVVTVAQNGSSIVSTVNGVTASTGTAKFQATDTIGESVTVKATDATDGLVLSTPVTFTTKPAFTADTPPPTGTTGIPYAGYTFAATGFPTPTYGIASGALPAGLTLSPTGALTGTPTSAGAFTFAVRASNGTTPATTPPVTITVTNPPAGPDVAVGLLRVGPLVSGHDGLYLISVTNNGRVATSGPLTLTGTLPPGLSFGSVTGIGWQCTAVHQTFACTRKASLPARATSLLALAVHVVAQPGSVVVTTVALGPPDSNPANNRSTDTSTVGAPPRR